MKKTVEDRLADKNRAEGQLAALEKQLKEEYGFDDAEAAEKKRAELEVEIRQLDEQIEADTAAFEKKYGMAR